MNNIQENLALRKLLRFYGGCKRKEANKPKNPPFFNYITTKYCFLDKISGTQ